MDEVEAVVVKREKVKNEKAVKLLKTFLGQDAALHSAPNEAVFQIRQIHTALQTEHKRKKEQENKQEH